MSRVPADATAFGDRSSEWMLSIDSTWETPPATTQNVAYTRAFWNAAHEHSDGKTYFNFPGLLEEGEAAVARELRREPRAARPHQGGLRPGESLPAQPEHPPLTA